MTPSTSSSGVKKQDAVAQHVLNLPTGDCHAEVPAGCCRLAGEKALLQRLSNKYN